MKDLATFALNCCMAILYRFVATTKRLLAGLVGIGGIAIVLIGLAADSIALYQYSGDISDRTCDIPGTRNGQAGQAEIQLGYGPAMKNWSDELWGTWSDVAADTPDGEATPSQVHRAP